MKKQFQITLILFLVFAFVVSPCLTGFSFASNDFVPPSPYYVPPPLWQRKIYACEHIIYYLRDNYSNQDYTFPKTIPDIEINREERHEKRNTTKQYIKNIWNHPPIRPPWGSDWIE